MESVIDVQINYYSVASAKFMTVPHWIAIFTDPRTAKWLLMSSPGPLLTILATYWYFCISAGPRYMKDRKPYDLKRVIQIYNAVQVLLSVYLFWEVSDLHVHDTFYLIHVFPSNLDS